MLLWLVFYQEGFVPFGTNTPAVTDAKLQYLDLFAYYRDVLTGQNSLSYTFSNTLGGSAVAIWAYYLASPFNLLVLLFPKEQMNLFLEVLITAKLSAASASFAWYIGHRFRDRVRRETAYVLSVSYGLMQYTLAQGSNVMWLDGVILLPFLVLGVYRTVHGRKEGRFSILQLAVPAALTVITNWYTGGINYLFSFVWLVYETARGKRKHSGAFGKYLAGLGLGLLLSSFLFVPNVFLLRLGKGAAFGIPAEGFWSVGFRGNPFSVLRNYRIGEISDSGKASFFCGSLALFGTAAFFCSGRIGRRDKAAGAGLLLFTVMSCFWQPLFVLFSLLQYSNSYWYRYGYLGSFVLLYLAAYWAGSLPAEPLPAAAAGDRLRHDVLKAGAASMLLVVLSQAAWPSGGMGSTRIAVLLLACITALFFTILLPETKRRRAAGIVLAGLCIFEMFLQTRAMLGIYHTDTAGEYAAYSRKEQEQIRELLSFDTDGFYRVNQTSTRIGNKDGLTAAYLDAMAYGYASISGYTSCPENIQLEFLDKMGYRKEYESFNIVNTSFLQADSMLGVRYILSSYAVPGLTEIRELGVHNGKAVYKNPYVLPAVMLLEEKDLRGDLPEEDPFAFVNRVYGELSGQETELFVPVTSKKQYEHGMTTWTLIVPEGNDCLYGNLPWKETMEGRLMVSEGMGYGYGDWLSPSVFFIPVTASAEAVRVTLQTPGEPPLVKEQFYALDLERLAEVTKQIRQTSSRVKEFSVMNGKISCTAEAAQRQKLILSVPASPGWTVRVNGQKTECEAFEDCLMQIPLVPGENHITMQYRTPGTAAGAGMTFIGVVLSGALLWKDPFCKKRIVKNRKRG